MYRATLTSAFSLMLLTFALPAAEKVPVKGKERWIPTPAAKVIGVDDGKDIVKVSQNAERRWKLGDNVCLTRNKADISCGEVILTTPTEATVRLNTVIPMKKLAGTAKKQPPKRSPAAQKGDAVWRQSERDLFTETQKTQKNIREVIEHRHGTTLVTVSQSSKETLRLDDTVCIFKDGIEKACGKVTKLFDAKAVVSLPSVPDDVKPGYIALMIRTPKTPEPPAAVATPAIPPTRNVYPQESITNNVITPAPIVAEPLKKERRRPAATATSEITPPAAEKPQVGLARLILSPAIGLRYVSYTETAVEAFYGHFLDARLAAELPLSTEWIFSISGSASLFAISQNATTAPRYIEVTGLAKYAILATPNIKLFLDAGWNFRALLTSDTTFGFQNANSPLFYPELVWQANEQSTISVSARVGPLLGHSFPANRVVDGSIAWATKLNGGNRFTLMLDYHTMTFGVSATGTDSYLASPSVSLSLDF